MSMFACDSSCLRTSLARLGPLFLFIKESKQLGTSMFYYCHFVD